MGEQGGFPEEVQDMLDAIELLNDEDLSKHKEEWKTISVYGPPMTAWSFQEQNDMDKVGAKGGSPFARDAAERIGELIEKDRVLRLLGNRAELLRWSQRTP